MTPVFRVRNVKQIHSKTKDTEKLLKSSQRERKDSTAKAMS